MDRYLSLLPIFGFGRANLRFAKQAPPVRAVAQHNVVRAFFDPQLRQFRDMQDHEDARNHRVAPKVIVVLQDVTRTFFERLSTISPPEEAARYRGLVDPQKTAAIQNYFADHDLGKYSVLRTAISPTMLSGGFRQNVIPSQAEAMLDIRAAG